MAPLHSSSRLTHEVMEHATVSSQLIDRTARRPDRLLPALLTHRELIRNLVWKDLKLKYRGSALGFLWSLANPLLMTAVYTFAFAYIIRVQSEGFVFRLVLALLSWNFFATATVMSTSAILDNSPLLKNVSFPRAILPTATVLFNAAQLVLSTVVLLPVLFLLSPRHVPLTIAFLPAVMVLEIAFTVGVALVLSAATTKFRDVRHLLDVCLAVFFWTTPIVYAFDAVPVELRPIVLASPLSPFIVALHDLAYFGRVPPGSVLVLLALYPALALAAGATVFRRLEPWFTENL